MTQRTFDRTGAAHASKLRFAYGLSLMLALGASCMAAEAQGQPEDTTDAPVQVEGCTLGDAMFEPGARVICADGCNTCTCGEAGAWASTRRACEPNFIERCDAREPSSTIFAVDPIYQHGDKLALSVQYRGGCFEHSWKLCFSDDASASADAAVSSESAPASAKIWLVDTTPEHDACYALPTRELVFDLSPIRKWHAAADAAGEPTVMLQLDRGYGIDSIAYRF